MPDPTKPDPKAAPRTNAEVRAAIRSKVTDVSELLANLTELTVTGPDTVPTLVWSRALVQVEHIRKQAFAVIDMLALSGREPVEVVKAQRMAKDKTLAK